MFSPTAFYRYLDRAKPGGLWELVNVVTRGRSHLRLRPLPMPRTTVAEGAGLAMTPGDGVPGLPEGLRQPTFPSVPR